MHPNPAFRRTRVETSLELVRSRGFGLLIVQGESSPHLAHIPVLLAADGTSLDLHLVRSNPISRIVPAAATLVVSGGDTYVSPDWYEVPDQVPTWNYVAVHISGRLDALPPNQLADVIARQSAHFEETLRPKRPWTMEKMSDDVSTRMMRQIVPMRLMIEAVDSTWKLGQNKPDPVRERAAAAVEAEGFGANAGRVASWMKAPPDIA